jgi:hypothetical protein
MTISIVVHEKRRKIRLCCENANLPSKAVCSSASPSPTACSSSFLFFLSLNSKRMPMNNRQPCSIPVTMYTPQALQPSEPNLIARLVANTKLPGVWMHIIGILRLMTCCSFQVVQSWGRYCMQARTAAQRPSIVAHVCKAFGYQSRKTADNITTTTKCATDMRTTVRASFHDGGGGASEGCSSGAGVGKKTRKRSILLHRLSEHTIQVCSKDINSHQTKTTPLHSNLRNT